MPFGKVEQEFEVLVGSKTRRSNDLTLFDKQGKPVCVFELKNCLIRLTGARPGICQLLPRPMIPPMLWAPTTLSPGTSTAPFSGKHISRGRAPYERSLIQYPSIAAIQSSEALDLPDVEAGLKKWVEDFLQSFARIVTGVVLAPPQPLDEGSIQTIQSYLDAADTPERIPRDQLMPLTKLYIDFIENLNRYPDFLLHFNLNTLTLLLTALIFSPLVTVGFMSRPRRMDT